MSAQEGMQTCIGSYCITKLQPATNFKMKTVQGVFVRQKTCNHCSTTRSIRKAAKAEAEGKMEGKREIFSAAGVDPDTTKVCATKPTTNCHAVGALQNISCFIVNGQVNKKCEDCRRCLREARAEAVWSGKIEDAFPTYTGDEDLVTRFIRTRCTPRPATAGLSIAQLSAQSDALQEEIDARMASWGKRDKNRIPVNEKCSEFMNTVEEFEIVFLAKMMRQQNFMFDV